MINILNGILIILIVSLLLYSVYRIFHYLVYRKALSAGKETLYPSEARKRLLYWTKRLFIVVGLFFTILIGGGIFIMEYEMSKPPHDSYYIKELEDIAKENLSSCVVLDKKYREWDYNIAIIQVSEEEFQKLLDGVIKRDLDRKGSSVRFHDFTLKMAKNNHIQKISEKFEERRGEPYYKLGFSPPDIIIYETNSPYCI